MVAGALRREAPRLGEEVLVRGQELVQERPTSCSEGAQLRRRRRGHARPHEGASPVLERHRTGGEVPDDGSQRAEPACPEDHDITYEGHHKKIGVERRVGYGERCVSVDPWAGHALAIGDCRRHARPGLDRQPGALRHILADEAVGRAVVEQSE